MKNKIEKAMTKDHKVKIPGFMILFLGQVLKERQIAIWEAMSAAEDAGLGKDQMLVLDAKDAANEVAGCMILQMIEETFGTDFLNAYVNGEVDFEVASSIPSSESIN